MFINIPNIQILGIFGLIFKIWLDVDEIQILIIVYMTFTCVTYTYNTHNIDKQL